MVKVSKSCVECSLRSHKRCSGGRPCSSCAAYNLKCSKQKSATLCGRRRRHDCAGSNESSLSSPSSRSDISVSRRNISAQHFNSSKDELYKAKLGNGSRHGIETMQGSFVVCRVADDCNISKSNQSTSDYQHVMHKDSIDFKKNTTIYVKRPEIPRAAVALKEFNDVNEEKHVIIPLMEIKDNCTDNIGSKMAPGVYYEINGSSLPFNNNFDIEYESCSNPYKKKLSHSPFTYFRNINPNHCIKVPEHIFEKSTVRNSREPYLFQTTSNISPVSSNIDCSSNGNSGEKRPISNNHRNVKILSPNSILDSTHSAYSNDNIETINSHNQNDDECKVVSSMRFANLNPNHYSRSTVNVPFKNSSNIQTKPHHVSQHIPPKVLSNFDDLDYFPYQLYDGKTKASSYQTTFDRILNTKLLSNDSSTKTPKVSAAYNGLRSHDPSLSNQVCLTPYSAIMSHSQPNYGNTDELLKEKKAPESYNIVEDKPTVLGDSCNYSFQHISSPHAMQYSVYKNDHKRIKNQSRNEINELNESQYINDRLSVNSTSKLSGNNIFAGKSRIIPLNKVFKPPIISGDSRIMTEKNELERRSMNKSRDIKYNQSDGLLLLAKVIEDNVNSREHSKYTSLNCGKNEDKHHNSQQLSFLLINNSNRKNCRRDSNILPSEREMGKEQSDWNGSMQPTSASYLPRYTRYV